MEDIRVIVIGEFTDKAFIKECQTLPSHLAEKLKEEVKDNAINLAIFSLAFGTTNCTEGLIFLAPGKQFQLSFGGTKVRSAGSIDLDNPEEVGEILSGLWSGIKPDYKSSVKPNLFVYEFSGVWFYLIQFEICGFGGGFRHGNVIVYTGSSLERAFEWFEKFRDVCKRFYPDCELPEDFTLCRRCKIGLTPIDFQIERLGHEMICKTCVDEIKKSETRDMSRSRALAKMNSKIRSVRAGKRVRIGCTFCGEDIDMTASRAKKSPRHFCSDTCLMLGSRAIGSLDRRKYSPQLLRLCMDWEGEICPINNCGSRLADPRNHWNVCKKHYVLIERSLKIQNQKRLAVLAQHGLEQI